MKINNYEICGETVSDEHSFSIKSSPETLRILSKHLYQNPKNAIVRELVSNAYDSTIRAKSEIPVDVTLSTNSLTIRDYGTGLAPKDITNLYTTYFHSTKKEEKESIGSFGLGAKTPFSYTDEFYIVTYWYGTKHHYTAFIDQDSGYPKIRKTKEEATLEKNGLRISFAIKISNERWTSILQQELLGFPSKIINCNIPISFLDKTREESSDTWIKIPKGRTELKIPVQPSVLVGHTLYPVSLSEDRLSTLYRLGIVLKFHPSEVEVTPSREELHFSNNTKQAIQTRTEETFRVWQEKALQEVNAVRDLYTLRKQYPELFWKFRGLLPKNIYYTPSGVSLVPPGNLVTTKTYVKLDPTVRSFCRTRNGTPKESVRKSCSVLDSNVFCYPKGRAPIQAIKNYLKAHRAVSHVFLFPSQQDLKAAQQEIGFPDSACYSTERLHQLVTPEIRSSNPKPKTIRNKFSYYRYQYRWNLITEQTYPHGYQVYVLLDRFKPVYMGNRLGSNRLITWAQSIFEITVLGISKKDKAQVPDLWDSLETFLYKRFCYYENIVTPEVWNTSYFRTSSNPSLLEKLQNISPIANRLLQEYKTYQDYKKEIELYSQLSNHLQRSLPSVENKYQLLYNEYPLLKELYSTPSKIQYVKLVEELRSYKERV